jgi:hypothetical protein
VQTVQVVAALDEIEDRGASGGPARPGTRVEQLPFDSGEERLGECVVPALSGAADRQTHSQLVCQRRELVYWPPRSE